MSDTAQRDIAVVRAAYDAWSERDMAATRARLAPDMIYVLHLDPAVFPFAGEHHGRDAFETLLENLSATFTYLRFERSRFTRDARGMVSFRVDYSYLHKKSRHILSSSYLAIVTVQDGLIVRIEEFPDAGFVEAFFRFSTAVAASEINGDGPA